MPSLYLLKESSYKLCLKRLIIEVMGESSESVFIECSLWVRHLSTHFIFMELYNFSNEETGFLEYNITKINQKERHSHSITQTFSKHATLKPIAIKIETYSLAHSLLVLILLHFALLSLYALPSYSIVNSLRTQVVSPL